MAQKMAPRAPRNNQRPTNTNSPAAPKPQPQQHKAPPSKTLEDKEPVAPKSSAKPVQTQKPTVKPTVAQKNLLFQKVAIFVDAENIEMSGLKHHEGRTDYKKILNEVGDREIIRILYYKPIYKEISQDFQNFWAGLGGEIRRPSKNADTFLVIDAVTMADKIDVAIILGGDKDFLPLMWFLRSRGCRVEIWSWPETTSPEVKEAADYYFPLDATFVMGKS